ncbi:ABC transporter family substrate-binding protein [Streptomyces sp. NPDC005435]|uniref:ABC transporter family substrate-binding protein n=1 Tax=Streptomyces sp. NPDC005435 TaxID=3154464 RepID=UPI003456DC66
MRHASAAAWIAATAAVASLVSGCGSPDHTAAHKKAAPRADGQDINARPLSGIRQGGRLNLAISQWITQYNINTVDGAQGDAQEIARTVLPHLFHSDARGAIHANPDFLVSAKVTSTSPQTVEYRLNPKAKWSDGTPLGWRDFRAQWQALNGHDQAYEAADSSGYDQIAKVAQGGDAHTVKITFSSPYADWQRLFDPLYPAKYTSTPKQFNKGWSEKAPVTGNAFKIGSYDRTTQTITLVRDPKWWGNKPKLDTIVNRVIDFSARTEAYLNKELDSANALLPEDYQRLVKAPDTDIRRGARWDEVHITLNGARGPLKDLRVRQAVQHAVDRKGVNEAFAKDLAFRLAPLDNHFFMPNQQGYRDTSGGYATYDPKAAGKLLDAAGWKDNGEGRPRTKGGKQLTLDYVLSSGGTSAQFDQAELVQQQLAQAGIKVNLKKVPANDYFSRFVNRGDFDLTSFRNVDAVFLTTLTPVFQQPRGRNLFQNFGSVGSPKIDALLKKAGQSTDRAEAARLYNEADTEIWRLGHSIELYQRPQINAVRSDLANYGAEGLADVDYTKVGWLKKAGK